MGLNLEQKQAMVAEVAAKLAAAQAVIVAEYRGLDVGRVTQLRAKARKSGLYLRVLKNTLARRAVKGTPFEKLTDKLGTMQAPVAKLVRTMNEVPGKFVRTLAAYRDSKEKAAA